MTNTSHEISPSLAALAHPDLEDSAIGHEIARMWEICQRGEEDPVACAMWIRCTGAEHEGRVYEMPVPLGRPGSLANTMCSWDPFGGAYAPTGTDYVSLGTVARMLRVSGEIVADCEIAEAPALEWRQTAREIAIF